jgi:hypothetical protein
VATRDNPWLLGTTRGYYDSALVASGSADRALTWCGALRACPCSLWAGLGPSVLSRAPAACTCMRAVRWRLRCQLVDTGGAVWDLFKLAAAGGCHASSPASLRHPGGLGSPLGKDFAFVAAHWLSSRRSEGFVLHFSFSVLFPLVTGVACCSTWRSAGTSRLACMLWLSWCEGTHVLM